MSKQEFIVNDEAWAQDLEKGVEDYTDMLFEAVWEGTEAVSYTHLTLPTILRV